MKKVLTVLVLCLLAGVWPMRGSNPLEMRFHNEATDTARITALLVEASRALPANAPAGERVAWFACRLLDTPYVAHTLEAPEGGEEVLTVDIDRLDCTTLVETVVAMAVTLGEGRTSWRDYVYNLRRLRYRGGETDGYASRLHYNCDWAMDNIHRGNITDVTTTLPKCKYLVRSIDFMTANRNRYPALADSTEYERMVGVENGYRNHRFPYIKTADLYDKTVQQSLREGDILAFVSNLKNLDITHMGIVVMKDGKPYALHASSTHGKVEISEVPLADFVKRNRYWVGVRIYRLKD